MFWFAPLMGAAVTAIIYGKSASQYYLSFSDPFIYLSIYLSISVCAEYAPLKPKKRENKDDMADALFMAKKKRSFPSLRDRFR